LEPVEMVEGGIGMLLGIDVGGTFTDAVAVFGESVQAYAKKPTTHGNLLEGILQAIDQVIHETGCTEFTRIALSTTIVTNALIEERIDKAGIFLLPGPGMDLSGLLPAEPFVLSGSIDHRGREMAPVVKSQVEEYCSRAEENAVFAVSGKFSVRNPGHELEVANLLRKRLSPLHVSLGSAVAGTLNFVRRTTSAYYNAAVWRQFNRFADAAEQALALRGILSPVYILKADGGTMPLSVARQYPVEAVFTGPAASVLGIMATTPVQEPAVSLDIGGTTTDIALWQDGVPLFAAQGANIAGYPSAVRAFRLKSVGLGGDSYVRREAGQLVIGPMRMGSAMAVRGPEPTLSDAMIAAGAADFGDRSLALEAMRKVMPENSPEATAQAILQAAAGEIVAAIEAMRKEQAAEPVYRVKDIVFGAALKPQLVLGAGGAAPGMVPLVAKSMGIGCRIPPAAKVANAIGAAVARPTVDITFRADTVEGNYAVAELGIRDKLPSAALSLYEAGQMAEQFLKKRAWEQGIEPEEMEVIQAEEFNVVRGFHTMGKIITRRLQVKPGVLKHIKEGAL
jgi:N-methylhydantoinase A/oxoprolinase/acetone carboxylase beta subunit